LADPPERLIRIYVIEALTWRIEREGGLYAPGK
jgi:hypothetical protein